MGFSLDQINSSNRTREAQGPTPELRKRELDFSAIMQSVGQKDTQPAKTREERIRDAVAQSAAKHNLSPALVFAFIKQESGFNPNARSPCGAEGLMQLMPQTARTLGVKDSYNIEQNIEGGCSYIRQMLDRFDGKLDHAIAAYNAGPGAVEKYNGVPPYAETKNYVPSVLAHFQKFSGGADISMAAGRTVEAQAAPRGLNMNLAATAVASAELMNQAALSVAVASNVQPLELPKHKPSSDAEPPPPPPSAMRV